MALLIINIDDETGWPQRIGTVGEEKMGQMARVVYGSIHNRYKAMQRELAERQHEADARAAEALLDDEPKIRRITQKVG